MAACICGCIAMLGCASAPPSPAPDRDGDGVHDAADGCPDEPEDQDHSGDLDGCADPDNDRDGILDVHDGPLDGSGFGVCRDVPEDHDEFEDADGCPDLDNDGDGIPDVDDRAPYNPVNHPTCKVHTLFHDRIYFALGSDRLDKATAARVLDPIAERLERETDVKLVAVVGYFGRGESKRLALRRAQTVVKYLTARGIAPSRLRAMEGGMADETRDAKTPRDRAEQRFVDFPFVEPQPMCCGSI